MVLFLNHVGIEGPRYDDSVIVVVCYLVLLTLKIAKWIA